VAKPASPTLPTDTDNVTLTVSQREVRLTNLRKPFWPALGITKGWIMLGHAISEEAGMLEMAEWLKRFVPELPVQLVSAGEPFWSPK